MILKAGELVDYIIEAVQQHGATQQTELRVRVGTLGPVYLINNLKGVSDQRGFSLLLELSPLPEVTS
jgi:hypothetical protein